MRPNVGPRKWLPLGLSMALALLASDCVVAETPAPPGSGAPAPETSGSPAPLPEAVAQATGGEAVSDPQTRAPSASAERAAPAPRAKPKGSDASNGERSSAAAEVASEQKVRSAEKLGLDLSSDAPLEIDSRLIDIVDADGGGERIRFSGGVKLRQGDLQLTCSVLDAYYPEGAQGRPERIVADGDVVVMQGDMELRCTRAEFDDSKCRTICLSSEVCGSDAWPQQPARLVRGDNSIEGRQLEFDLCTSRLSGSCGARVVLNPEKDPKPAVSGGGAEARTRPAASDGTAESETLRSEAVAPAEPVEPGPPEAAGR